MARETLHETGITIMAAMATVNIRIDNKINIGDPTFGEGVFTFNFVYLQGPITSIDYE
jgi:hypothetical protein